MIAPTRQQLDRLTDFRLHDSHVEALTGGQDLFEAFGVTTPLRMAHFLAQACTETTGLSQLRENLTYTRADRIRAVFGTRRFPTIESAEEFVRRPQALAEKVYGGRLGNTQEGDGWRYRGGGLIQLTGRDNYRVHGRLSDLPLESQPDLLEQPEASLKAALSYWRSLRINDWADKDDVHAVSRAVNRGDPQSRGEPHGLNDRIIYLGRAKSVLGVPEGPAPTDELTIGDRGDAVRALQEDLKHLTYLLGEVDGMFGLQTHRAVKLFEEEHGLPIDGVFTGADRIVLEEVKNQPVRAAEERERALRGTGDVDGSTDVEPGSPAPQPDADPGLEPVPEPSPTRTPISDTESPTDQALTPAPTPEEKPRIVIDDLDPLPTPNPMDPPTTHTSGSSNGFIAWLLSLFGRR